MPNNIWQKILASQPQLSADRISGMFLGIAIGDALGLPLEMLSPQEILSRFGRVTTFISNPTHKWYSKASPGTWSDDTQLSLAVAEALIKAGFSISELKRAHVLAADETTCGWGKTTRLAVEQFRNAPDDHISGEVIGAAYGTGNGVIMKLAPLAAWLSLQKDGTQIDTVLDAFTDLTHPTALARTATKSLAAGFLVLTRSTPESFNSIEFINAVVTSAQESASDEASIELTQRLLELKDYKTLGLEETIARWGGASSYVLDSLPASLLYFLRNHNSFEGVIEAANAGGDTDSNASIVGALLGLLHGSNIFPKDLVTQVQNVKRILDTSCQFYNILGLSQSTTASS